MEPDLPGRRKDEQDVVLEWTSRVASRPCGKEVLGSREALNQASAYSPRTPKYEFNMLNRPRDFLHGLLGGLC